MDTVRLSKNAALAKRRWKVGHNLKVCSILCPYQVTWRNIDCNGFAILFKLYFMILKFVLLILIFCNKISSCSGQCVDSGCCCESPLSKTNHSLYKVQTARAVRCHKPGPAAWWKYRINAHQSRLIHWLFKRETWARQAGVVSGVSKEALNVAQCKNTKRTATKNQRGLSKRRADWQQSSRVWNAVIMGPCVARSLDCHHHASSSVPVTGRKAEWRGPAHR